MIGAGVAGVAAARQLADRGIDVVVFEASKRIGGKLLTTDFAGFSFDEGAESIATRDPAVVALLDRIGLSNVLVDPATTAARLLVRGSLRPLPVGTVLGVPSSARSLVPTFGRRAAARASLDHVLPRRVSDADLSVGRLVRRRLGSAVADRLVDPLLGGVYAGRADGLSLAATVPALAGKVRTHRSLLDAASAARLPGAGGPRLQALSGGMATLPSVLAHGLDVRTSTTVRELARTANGWQLTTGPVPDPRTINVDGVVLAVPARPAARLLDATHPAAAEVLNAVEYASIAVVSLAFARADAAHLTGSGLLVPAVEGWPVKAVTFSTNKWTHIADAAPDMFVLRCSIGRHGETVTAQRTDAELVTESLRFVADVLQLRADPLEARVSRWGGGLPQYAVGHLDAIAAARAALAETPTLDVCGAAYAGVGIAACLTGGAAAADRVADAIERAATMHE